MPALLQAPLSASMLVSHNSSLGVSSLSISLGLDTDPVGILDMMGLPALAGITDKALTFLGVGCGSGKPRAQLDVFLEQSNQGIEYGVAVAITSTALETAVDFAVVLALDDEGRPRICFRFDGGMSRCLAAEQICGAGDMCPDGYHCMGKSVCVQCTADEHCRDREDGATTCKVFNRFTSLGNLTGLSSTYP